MSTPPAEVTEAPEVAADESYSDPELAAAREARLASARAFSAEAARLCADRRMSNVRALDVTGQSPVCDFFVLATAGSGRQMGSVARELEELAHEHDLRPIHSIRRLEPNDRWVAIDLIDVIVHLFSDEARLYYDLDNLWGEARAVDWNEGRDDRASPAPSPDDSDEPDDEDF